MLSRLTAVFLLTFAVSTPGAMRAAEGGREIRIFRIGSSSFNYELIENAAAVLAARGNVRLACDEERDKAGYSRLDDFVREPGAYEAWRAKTLPKIQAGAYDYVIVQTIGWTEMTPEEMETLFGTILPDLASKVKEAGAEMVLYDKYVPLDHRGRQQDPRAQAWSGRYPEGVRLNNLLHVVAARRAGVSKVLFVGAAVHDLWGQERFRQLGFLYNDAGHPGTMANYLASLCLVRLLGGVEVVGNPLRQLRMQGWTAAAFGKLPQSARQDQVRLHERNRSRVREGVFELNDEEADILQHAATRHQGEWDAILKKNLADDKAFADTVAEVKRIIGEREKFAEYGFDAETVAALREKYAKAVAPGQLPPRELLKIRSKVRTRPERGLEIRIGRLLPPRQATAVGKAYAEYWDGHNNKFRDDVYFEARHREARMRLDGNLEAAQRLKRAGDIQLNLLSLAGYKLLLAALDEAGRRQICADYATSFVATGRHMDAAFPAFNAAQLKAAAAADDRRLVEAWDVMLAVWEDPNLMDCLKASDFADEVWREADRRFAEAWGEARGDLSRNPAGEETR